MQDDRQLLLPLGDGALLSISAMYGLWLRMAADDIRRKDGDAAAIIEALVSRDRYRVLLQADLITGPRMDIVDNLIAGTPDRGLGMPAEMPRIHLTKLGELYLAAYLAYEQLLPG